MKYTFVEMKDRLSAASESEWSDSKLRYYLLDILKIRVGSPGVRASYPAQTLGKLLFLAKVMESPIKPSIKQALRLMEQVPAGELTLIGEGAKPVELSMAGLDEASEQEPLSMMRVTEASFADEPMEEPSQYRAESARREAPGERATDYVTRVFSQHLGASAPKPRATKQSWREEVNFGPDLQIRCRKPLTKSQKEQLMLAGQLLRYILGEEK